MDSQSTQDVNTAYVCRWKLNRITVYLMLIQTNGTEMPDAKRAKVMLMWNKAMEEANNKIRDRIDEINYSEAGSNINFFLTTTIEGKLETKEWKRISLTNVELRMRKLLKLTS